jgi:Spy/CpxP family protein refolding chaperone
MTSRRRALFAVTAVFLLGIVVGILATHVFYARRLAAGGLADLGIGLAQRRIEARLDLTAEQQRRLEEILAADRRELEELRHDVIDRLLAMRDASHQELARELTPEQRQQLDELRREADERLEEWLE